MSGVTCSLPSGRELTDRPFGGNVLIPDLEEGFPATDEDRAQTHATIAAIFESRGEDTFLGELFDGGWPDSPHRAIKGKTDAEWDAAGRPPPGRRPGEGEPIGRVRRPSGDSELLRYHSAMLTPEFERDVGYAPLRAGSRSTA